MFPRYKSFKFIIVFDLEEPLWLAWELLAARCSIFCRKRGKGAKSMEDLREVLDGAKLSGSEAVSEAVASLLEDDPPPRVLPFFLSFFLFSW